MYSMSVGACCVAAESAVFQDIITSYVNGGYFSGRFSISPGVYFVKRRNLVFGILQDMSMVHCYTS